MHGERAMGRRVCACACVGGLHLEAREDLREDLRLDDDLGELDRMLCDLREAHAHLCVSMHTCLTLELSSVGVGESPCVCVYI